jgi:plastocyanin
MGNRGRAGVLILAAAALIAPTLAIGAPPTSQVTVKDDSFSPRQPAVLKFGGKFTWVRAANSVGDHNVHQAAGLFRSGKPTATSFTPAHPYSISPSAGSYVYFCDAHRSLNMVGTIKVRPIVQTGTLTSTGFRVRWASAGAKQTGSRFDVRYQVGSGPWKVWRNDTSAANGAFGAANKPVRVMPGRTYRIEVRSEKQQVSKHSDWSPPLVVKPPS